MTTQPRHYHAILMDERSYGPHVRMVVEARAALDGDIWRVSTMLGADTSADDVKMVSTADAPGRWSTLVRIPRTGMATRDQAAEIFHVWVTHYQHAGWTLVEQHEWNPPAR